MAYRPRKPVRDYLGKLRLAWATTPGLRMAALVACIGLQTALVAGGAVTVWWRLCLGVVQQEPDSLLRELRLGLDLLAAAVAALAAGTACLLYRLWNRVVDAAERLPPPGHTALLSHDVDEEDPDLGC